MEVRSLAGAKKAGLVRFRRRLRLSRLHTQRDDVAHARAVRTGVAHAGPAANQALGTGPCPVLARRSGGCGDGRFHRVAHHLRPRPSGLPCPYLFIYIFNNFKKSSKLSRFILLFLSIFYLF
jgi:hypothetical protein